VNVKMIVFCILILMCCLIKSADQQQGKLTVITGPMYAEKTAQLITYIKICQANGSKIVTYSHKLDARKENKLCSRALPTANIFAFKTADPSDIAKDFLRGDFNCVAIDEAQFFDQSLCKFIHMLLECKAQVFVAGLDMNFKGQPFGHTMGMLCQMADEVVKLKARCSVCNNRNANMTQRLVNGKPAHKDDPELVVEGSSHTITYEPRCRNCFKLME
jgi:thymidine kinase